MNLQNKILQALNKFNLDLNGKKVLTEAASGNYVVTPIIAALAGADVVALTKESKYASISQVIESTLSMARSFQVEDKIKIITSLQEEDLSSFDILTNTGFNRPINKEIIDQLSAKCVIPLMWEPWEFRPNELDIDACASKGIYVYGTDESDPRLGTMQYIGYTVLLFLLENKRTPFSSNILIVGDNHFGKAIGNTLKQNKYNYYWICDYSGSIDLTLYDVIVFAEHQKETLLIGKGGFLEGSDIDSETLLIHIAGKVDFSTINCMKIPLKPAMFGQMSFTADFIDNIAVIDLHTAGLKVAEGMIEANLLNLKGLEYRRFMENNYPAMAFKSKKYW